jgi:hypothetical protein
MQVLHVVTLGDVGSVTSMHRPHQADLAMQEVRGSDDRRVPEGYDMQFLHRPDAGVAVADEDRLASTLASTVLR